MKKYIIIGLLIIVNLVQVLGIDTEEWTGTIPNVCQGTDSAYTIGVTAKRSITEIKCVLRTVVDGTWQVYDAESLITEVATDGRDFKIDEKSLLLIGASGGFPTSFFPTKPAKIKIKTKNLSPQYYKVEISIYIGTYATRVVTKEFKFNVKDISNEFVLTTDIPLNNKKLSVCPSKTKHAFYLEGSYASMNKIRKDKIVWKCKGVGAAKVDTATPEDEKNFIFTANEDNSNYTVIVETSKGCAIRKELTIYPKEKYEISDEIIASNLGVCKQGRLTTLSIKEQTWADSYTWSVVGTDKNKISLEQSGDRFCTIRVNDDTEIGYEFKVRVDITGGCSKDDKVTNILTVVGIEGKAKYINSNDQSTIPIDICYNSTSIPIEGPTSKNSNYPINEYSWYDASTESVLNEKFTASKDISVNVKDNRGCTANYQFNVNVIKPPEVVLSEINSCYGEDVEINVSSEFDSKYKDSDFSWYNALTNGKISNKKELSFSNPETDLDLYLNLKYFKYDDKNTCNAKYNQKIKYNAAPEFNAQPEKICKGSDVRIIGVLNYNNSWFDYINTIESPSYLIEDIEDSTSLILTAEKNNCFFTKKYTIGVKTPKTLKLANGNFREVCNGEDIELTVPSKFTNVNWFNGETNQSILLENVKNTRTIFVSAEENGCYVEANISIIVNDKPNIILNTGKEGYCENQKFNVSLQYQNGSDVGLNDFKIRDWSHGIDSWNENTFKFNESTEISCRVVNNNNCSSTAYKTIEIYDNPEISIPNQYVCEGKDLTIYPDGDFEDYLWHNGTTNSNLTLTNLKIPVTNARLKVTDINTCVNTAEFEIQIFDVNNIVIEPINICKGETTSLTAPSGFDSYLWNTGQTTRTIEVSPEDDYDYLCTVSDGDCEIIITYEVIVNSVDPFTLGNVYACKGANTEITGEDGYDNYAWNYEGATTKDLIFKTNNNFTLSLTAWKNGCPYTASAQVVVVEAESFNFEDKSVCEGLSTSYTAPAGYDYLWSDGSTEQIGTFKPSETSTHSLTITTNNSEEYACTSTDEFTIEVKDFIDFELKDKEICRGTTTIIETSPIYTSYLWTTGETTSSIEVSPVANDEYIYGVTVTDWNGCSGSAESKITVMDNISITLENVTMCKGESKRIGLDNGIEYDSYTWNNGSNQSTQSVSPNSTTNYSLTVTDEMGCEATTAMQVVVFNPRIISIDPITVCENQTAELISPNGLTNHTWNGRITNEDKWSIDDIKYNQYINFSALDDNGCKVLANTSVIVNRNPVLNIADKYMCKFESSQLHIPGIYSSYNWSNGSTETYTDIYAIENEDMFVTVTDANGCETTETFSLEIYEYTPITLLNQSMCKGDAVTISLEGDWVSQNWSNGKTSYEITESPLATSGYSVTATDLNGCKSNASMAVTVNNPTEYELPEINFCSGESINITADPGFKSYLWSTGETSQSIEFSATENELVTLNLIDNNDCETNTKKIAVVYNKPEIYLPDYYVCVGNSIDIEAPGGYTYIWDNGETSRINTVSPIIGTTYGLKVIDNYNCSATASSTVEVKPIPVLNIASHTICPGEVLNLDGGSGFNSYSWSNGVIGRFNTIKPEMDRDYTLSVKDIYGCEARATSSVIVHNVNELNLSPMSVCNGDTIEYMAQGGFEFYKWTTGDTNRILRSVLSNYNKIGLTVTDANSCKQYKEVDITSLEKPDFNLLTRYTSCKNESITANLKLGYIYEWNDGSSLNPRTFWPTSSIEYSLEAEHVNGCKTTKSTVVSASSLENIYLEDRLSCDNELTEFNLINSENLKFINWSTGDKFKRSILLKSSKDSLIKVNYEDYNGCADSASANLILKPGIALNLQDRYVCEGESISIFAGGVYDSYLWSTGETTAIITIVGEFSRRISLKVQNNNGCYYEGSFNLYVNPTPKIDLYDMNICFKDTIRIGSRNNPEYSYRWNTGDTTSIINKYVNVDKQYILVAKDRENSCITIDTANIFVFPTPELEIPNQFANIGETILLSVPNNYDDVTWSTGDTTQSILFETDSNQYIYVIAIDENSCFISDEIFVYVAGPEKNILSSDTVCSGEACVISARRGYKEYKWSNGETNHYIITYDNSNTDYEVEITDFGGKKNIFKTKSYIKQGPNLNISDTSVCFGQDLNLNLGLGYAKYYWSTGDTTNKIEFNDISENFLYTVLVEGQNGCAEEKSAYVTIHQNNYNIIGLKDNYNPGESINISISNSEQLNSCLINIDGVEYNSTAVNTKIYDVGEIEISFMVQDKTGCYYEQVRNILISGEQTNTDITSNDNWLFVYPNPVTNSLNIEVGEYEKGYNIAIVNSSGQIIFSSDSNSDIYTLDFVDYPEGIYILNVVTNNKTFIKTFVKQ